MLQSTIHSLSDSVVALGRGARRGSGVVIGENRVAVPSYRLADDRVEVILSDGRRSPGELAGVDRHLGIGLLRAETADLPAVDWSDRAPQVGDSVFALGDPGSGLRITQGTVSATPVSVRSRAGRPIAMIEHTAPIPRGAGGGPLADESGGVVGLNALRGDPGFLLAIPAAAVRGAIEGILAGREQVRLGVALSSTSAARRMRSAVGLPDRPGLLVRGVESASPAARAGVLRGDLLVRLGDSDLAGLDDLLSALDANAGRDAVRLGVARGSEESELAVDLSGGAA
jgi:serine protease Do